MNKSIEFIGDLRQGCRGTTNEVLIELQKVFGYLHDLCNDKNATQKIILDSINNIRGNKSDMELTEKDLNNLNLVHYMEQILMNESSIFNIGLGIIGMEFVDHRYKTFDKLYYDIWNHGSYKEEVKTYENMARLKLIELALKTGYSQCDFHATNIMIAPTLPGYYQGYNGRVMLIDFGYAKKIPLDKLAEIKDSYANGDYMNCIKIIFGLGRIDGDPKNIFVDYLYLFGWIPHLYSNLGQRKIENTPEMLNTLNEEIGSLIIAQEEAINDRIKMFDKLHKKNPGEGIYPLLPLSNQIKNSLFEGMIKVGGRRKNKKHRTYRRRKLKSKTYKKSGRSRQSKQK